MGIDLRAMKQWVRWGFEAPTPTNPLLNQTCTTARFLPVTFIPGAIETGLETDCSVRWGTTLIMSPGGSVCSQGPDPTPPAPTCASDEFGLIDAVSLTIDGKPVADLSRFVVSTSEFSLNLPEDNLFGGPPGPSPTFFKGYIVMFAVPVPRQLRCATAEHLEAHACSSRGCSRVV